MITGQKLLITGGAGSVASSLAEYLAGDNEVWALGRFTNAADRPRLEALGIKCCVADLGSGDLSAVPADFDYLPYWALPVLRHWSPTGPAMRSSPLNNGVLERRIDCSFSRS